MWFGCKALVSTIRSSNQCNLLAIQRLSDGFQTFCGRLCTLFQEIARQTAGGWEHVSTVFNLFRTVFTPNEWCTVLSWRSDQLDSNIEIDVKDFLRHKNALVHTLMKTIEILIPPLCMSSAHLLTFGCWCDYAGLRQAQCEVFVLAPSVWKILQFRCAMERGALLYNATPALVSTAALVEARMHRLCENSCLRSMCCYLEKT